MLANVFVFVLFAVARTISDRRVKSLNRIFNIDERIQISIVTQREIFNRMHSLLLLRLKVESKHIFIRILIPTAFPK